MFQVSVTAQSKKAVFITEQSHLLFDGHIKTL
jgi:hypothetical protein